MPRCICRVYACNTCRTGDRRVERWTSDVELIREGTRTCGGCGEPLDSLCDSCGGPLVHVRTEDVTWHYLGMWSVFLAMIIAGGIVGRWRGLLVGLLSVALLTMVLAWRRARGPSVVDITHDHEADELMLDALRARARAHEQSREMVMSLAVSALFVAGVIAGLCHLGAGWWVAAVALGAALSSSRWMAIGRQQILAVDSRAMLTMMRRHPGTRQALKLRERLRVNARRVLGRQPDAWELKRIEEEFERALDRREYVASTHERSDLAMLRLVVLRAMAGGNDGGKPEGTGDDERAEERRDPQDADGRGQHAERP
jgi:hypothetical protein